MRLRIYLTLLGNGLIALTAYGQSSGANITLQLPSFSQFGVNTTVVVPDGGAAAFGGGRAAATSGDRWRGVGRNRAIGVARGATQTSVTAQIHDPQQAEAALHAAGGPQSSQQADRLGTTTLRRRTDDPAPGSATELAQQRAANELAGDRAARELFEKGRRAQQAGKSALAANYYRASSRQASAALRAEINQQWRTLVGALQAKSEPSGGPR